MPPPASSATVQQPVAMPVSLKRPACRECRARKVRCNRASGRCGPCTRFDLGCSYSATIVSASNSDAATNTRVTQAGLVRRRSRRACSTCRALKARCSGDLPCTRCQSKSLSCAYGPRVVDVNTIAGPGPDAGSADATFASPSPSRAVDIDEAPPAIQSNSASAPAPPSAPPDPHSQHHRPATAVRSDTPHPRPPFLPPPSPASARLIEDSSRAFKDLEAFFDSPAGSPIAIQFLHRSSILADWSQGRLDSTLAATLCALGRLNACEPASSLIDPRAGDGDGDDIGIRDARAWLGEAQQVLVGKFGAATIAQLQTLILIMQYRVASGDVMDAWSLVALGARLAFTLRLNYELPGWDHDPVIQETRRRMVWSIWLIDRLLAGGIEDLVVCPTERIHILLPCDDYTFQRGIASRAESLADPASRVDAAGQDALGYYLRLLECRHRILRYATSSVRCLTLARTGRIECRIRILLNYLLACLPCFP